MAFIAEQGSDFGYSLDKGTVTRHLQTGDLGRDVNLVGGNAPEPNEWCGSGDEQNYNTNELAEDFKCAFHVKKKGLGE